MPGVIDVWDARSFDLGLLKVLKEQAEEITSYFDTDHAIFLSYDNLDGPDRPILRPDNPHAAAYYALLDRVGDLLASRTIRAFHYTRLTDDEVAELRRSGIHLSTPTTLRRRLDALVVSGALPADIGDQLYDASPFHSEQRDARSEKFWMVSHPIAFDDKGVAPLMARWGGEVASFWVSDAALFAPLARLGKARIAEIAVPLEATRHSHAASKAVVATFGRARGAIPEKSVFDLYLKASLPASAVFALHTEGDAAFIAMGRTYPADFVDVDVGRWKELTGEED
ncbi:hypothetical protein CN166_12550 [Sinorhizobium medicae]|uniref:hypothetical protein n=1 Tax=Sinorhizobium medicae TaxID=110321 RepID=UPI000FD1C73C|nr:hypothetical protein [Sinorhizobium medicae]RVJ59511.1 hypothetical protein CN166_12550 [Sinorhizobium medicae]